VRLIAFNEPQQHDQAVEDRIEAKLTERQAMFEVKDLRAVALEQTAGEIPPQQALLLAKEMISDRRVLTLEGGQMTTLAIRAQEQAIERRAAQLAQPAGRDAGHAARENAKQEVAEHIASPLNPEQQQALRMLTGPERAAVLIGPAGTGKGVVIDAAVRAEQLAGHEMIGVAVSWSNAERLGTDSPALQGTDPRARRPHHAPTKHSLAQPETPPTTRYTSETPAHAHPGASGHQAITRPITTSTADADHSDRLRDIVSPCQT
jgi:hypothetical protein